MRFLKALLLVGLVSVVLAGGIGLIYGGNYLRLSLYKTFAPAYEEARTDVYRNTRAYQEGSIRDLRRLKREYEKEDDAGRAALRTIIRQRADELDYDKLPGDLQRFLETL